ncbi:MAG: hypothetical protein ACTHU0_18320 [Kofleriaceae bacterium]
MGKAQTFGVGDVVQTVLDERSAFVVVAINTHSDKVRVSKCGTTRWHAPGWKPATSFEKAPSDSGSRAVQRARRLLAKLKPGPDGWKRIECGKPWALERCAVGHEALDSRADGTLPGAADSTARTPREAVYDERIAPLMQQVIAICKEHGINAFAEFSLGYDEASDQTLFCTTVLPVDKGDAEGHEVITSLAQHRRRLMASGLVAFTITEEAPNG